MPKKVIVENRVRQHTISHVTCPRTSEYWGKKKMNKYLFVLPKTLNVTFPHVSAILSVSTEAVLLVIVCVDPRECHTRGSTFESLLTGCIVVVVVNRLSFLKVLFEQNG